METYVARRSGSVGHEVLLDGEVIAWTVDEAWAMVIASLLNRVEAEGLGCLLGVVDMGNELLNAKGSEERR
jgi:hypothetical protein